MRRHCGSHAARAIVRIGILRWHMNVCARAQRDRFAGGGCALGTETPISSARKDGWSRWFVCVYWRKKNQHEKIEWDSYEHNAIESRFLIWKVVTYKHTHPTAAGHITSRFSWMWCSRFNDKQKNKKNIARITGTFVSGTAAKIISAPIEIVIVCQSTIMRGNCNWVY